jgi:predicted GH43/DUF377 family glycosyl hydrolase
VSGPDAASSLVTRSAVHLTPDCARVYDAIFMPGQELPGDHSRATAVINRVLGLEDVEVRDALAELRAWFPDRPSLDETYLRHFDVVAHRLGTNATPSPHRRLLIGAYFTHDVAPEAAALTNPSIVAHPDQSGTAPGELRFVLSARAIGEGHVSSIEFRTGVVASEGQVRVDPTGDHLETPRQEPSVYRRASFVTQLNEGGMADETTHLVLDRLGDTFDRTSLEASIARLPARLLGRASSRDAVSSLLAIADNTYTVSFAPDTEISERILVPTGPTESNGLEDARLVRFVDDDGSATYLATYTAYDGRQITPQLLRTDDFRTFTAHQLSGPAAKNKGMALFPRRIDGRFACLTRWDRECSFVAWSDDAMSWDSAAPIQAPGRWWDLIQVGNCGSPIETSAGWLVLTHGVGPMRTYAIGVMLLDLERPDRVLATLPTPLIAPHGEERIGYVPNVVYSCGGLVHRDRLVVPYGYGDRAVTIAVVDLPALLGVLTGATRASA